MKKIMPPKKVVLKAAASNWGATRKSYSYIIGIHIIEKKYFTKVTSRKDHIEIYLPSL